MASNTVDQPTIERSEESNSALQGKEEALVKWIEELGGGLSPDVEIYRDSTKGACLRVRADHAMGLSNPTLVARCPVTATFSILNVTNEVDGMPSHSFIYSEKFLGQLGKDAILSFFLMHEYLQGDTSYWWPYIATLPKTSELTALIWYEGEEVDWLSSTNLQLARESRIRALKEQYDTGIALLMDTSSEYVRTYSWKLYCWAYSIIASRSFTSDVLFGYLQGFPNVKGKLKDRFQVLVPLIDFANHKPLARIEWRAEASEVGLLVLESVGAGQEIHNNYGPLNNLQLMTTYGFCTIDNICDFREVAITPSPGSPLHAARKEQFQRFYETNNESEENGCFILNMFHPLTEKSTTSEGCIFSPRMLDTMALLRVNGREAVAIEVQKDRIYANVEKYVNSRLILNALSQCVDELTIRIMQIKMDGYFGKVPQSQKQRNTLLYRHSQLIMFETGIIVCAWALNRAKRKKLVPIESDTLFQKYLSYIPEVKSGMPIRERLRKIITGRESLVKHHGELFLNEEVVQALPQKVGEQVLIVIRAIIRDCAAIIESSQGCVTRGMVTYIIFLCYCIAAYRNTSVQKEKEQGISSSYLITERLNKYMGFLNKYHAAPEDGSRWVLDDDLEEDVICRIHEQIIRTRNQEPRLFQPLESLVGPFSYWLSENWLKWAWLTGDEEAVSLSRDPLPMLFEKGADESPQKVMYDDYFYIPQLPEQGSSTLPR